MARCGYQRSEGGVGVRSHGAYSALDVTVHCPSGQDPHAFWETAGGSWTDSAESDQTYLSG